MRELGRRGASSLEDQHVLESICQMVLAANDVADVKISIIGTRCQVIRRHAVAAKQSKILDVVSGFHLITINCIGEAHVFAGSTRHAKAEGKRLSSGSPAIAFVPRQLSHSRIE